MGSIIRTSAKALAILLGLLAPLGTASAFQLNACWAGFACIDGATLFRNANDAFFFAAGIIALTIFLIGAFMMVIGGVNETILQNAKKAMKGSLIGLALITGSYGIYRTVLWWFY